MASQSCDVKNIIPICSCDTHRAIANSLTCVQLHKRAIAVMLMERDTCRTGPRRLVYPPGKNGVVQTNPCLKNLCITPIGASWPCCVTTEMGPDSQPAHSVDCVLCAV